MTPARIDWSSGARRGTGFESAVVVNFPVETGSMATASATRQSAKCGDFLKTRELPRIGGVVVLALGL
jgi:hypothetical protein